MSEKSSRPGLDTLADYLEGLLSAQESREVERWIAEDADTAALLRELEELPSLLSAQPVEPMPRDVVDRVDAALAEAARADATPPDAPAHSTARPDTDRSGSPGRTGAVVMPLRRRRWVAPALAAAAMVGVVAIGAQVLSNVDTGHSDSAGSAGESLTDQRADGSAEDAQEPSAVEEPGGDPPGTPADGARVPPPIRTDSFATDVAEAFRVMGSSRWRDNRLDVSAHDTAERSAYSILADTCPVEVGPGRVYPIRLDGDAAVLVIRRVPGEPDQREALAYPARCPADDEESTAVPLASAVIEQP